MAKTFEETYQNYPFAPLVRFGVLVASYIIRILRNRKTAPDNANSVIDQHRSASRIRGSTITFLEERNLL